MPESHEQLPEGYLSVGRWINADFFLPRACHLPVEVDTGQAPFTVLATASWDWRRAKRWRSVTLTKSKLKELAKEENE